MKTWIFASLFLGANINIIIQVTFPNIIAYLDETFERWAKWCKFQNEIILLNGCKL
jgi:hypothetical protein